MSSHPVLNRTLVSVATLLVAGTAGIGKTSPVPSRSPAQQTSIQGQGQASPPRDRMPAVRAGTGAIRGRVVDGVTGRGLSRARVRVMTGGVMRDPAMTDETGAFEIGQLPAGSYVVSVERQSYLPTQFPEPGKMLRNRFQPLVLRNGQVMDDVVIPLHRGGVIAGRVLDAQGEVIEGANVQAFFVPRSGRPQMRSGLQTNDLGEYRLPRLPPGRYLIRVRPQNQTGGDMAVVRLPVQPIPTYYPSVLAIDQAQAVEVRRGETTTGIDITTIDGVPSVVSGTVVAMDGSPVGGNGGVQPRLAESDFMGFEGLGGGGIRMDGTFRLELPPGDYVLEAQAMPRIGPNQTPRPEMQQFGATRVSVSGNGTPVEGVTITLGRGAHASGRVIFETAGAVPPSPGQVRVPLYGVEGARCPLPQATIGPDWTFTVESLNGTCNVAPQGVFGGRWTLKAVMLRGENIMDRTITFEPGQQYTNVQIIVTDKRTQLDFVVADENGQPTREYVAIVFPVNKELWKQPSRIRTYSPQTIAQTPYVDEYAGTATTTARNQPQRIISIPAGEYLAVAVDDILSEATRDPEVLAELAVNATKVTVTPDAPVELSLQRVKISDLIR